MAASTSLMRAGPPWRAWQGRTRRRGQHLQQVRPPFCGCSRRRGWRGRLRPDGSVNSGHGRPHAGVPGIPAQTLQQCRLGFLVLLQKHVRKPLPRRTWMKTPAALLYRADRVSDICGIRTLQGTVAASVRCEGVVNHMTAGLHTRAVVSSQHEPLRPCQPRAAAVVGLVTSIRLRRERCTPAERAPPITRASARQPSAHPLAPAMCHAR